MSYKRMSWKKTEIGDQYPFKQQRHDNLKTKYKQKIKASGPTVDLNITSLVGFKNKIRT